MLTSLVVALSLAVPYLPQTEALCGGAAAAMVFRYWGDTHADIEPFAPLVDERAGGIADDVLVKAIEQRGWRAHRFAGSMDTLTGHIQNGRPVVILVHDRGTLFHYLVVTGIEPATTASPEAVIVHDPTWGPSRRIALRDLMSVWRPANFWSLVILPGQALADRRGELPAAAVARDVRPESRPGADAACDRLLNAALDNAAGKTPAETFALIDRVRLECPGSAAPLREMAGARFAERRWQDAAGLADRAAALDATDHYTWDLLASSRFMQDDLPGALQAWNRIGKPLINLVQIDGLDRARFQTMAAVMGLQPNMVLTERAFVLADRRLRELPLPSAVRLTLRPETDGYVTVRAAIAERSGPPRTAAAWAVTAIQTAVEREARLAIPGSTGQGELWSAGWRWWPGRPRVAMAFAAPQVGAFRGVWRVEGSWESQSYSAPGANGDSGRVDESRLHAGLSLSDWPGANLRYSVTVGGDTWRGATYRGRTVFAGGSLERRWQQDRWTVTGAGTAWLPVSGGAAFHAAGMRAAFRSSRSTAGWVYLADAGAERASDLAPLAIWPGAGDGHSRAPLLRAHPLLDGGSIDLERLSAFGRTLTYSHAEAQRWIAGGTPVRFGVAAFADIARASRRRESSGRSPTQVDVGTGLRLSIPGAAGSLRIDLAHGLRDGADAVTVGWQF